MPTRKAEFKKVVKIWQELIGQQSQALSSHLNELEISSLSACIGDCYESFQEIYFDVIAKLEKVSKDDHDTLHDCVTDIYWAFDHIKNHIIDAEKGFSELMNLLAKKAEEKEKREKA